MTRKAKLTKQQWNIIKLLILIVLALGAIAAYMLIGIDFDKPRLVEFAMKLRTPKLIAMLVAAFAIEAASIVFQSIINNRIVTPCLLGSAVCSANRNGIVFSVRQYSILDDFCNGSKRV